MFAYFLIFGYLFSGRRTGLIFNIFCKNVAFVCEPLSTIIPIRIIVIIAKITNIQATAKWYDENQNSSPKNKFQSAIPMYPPESGDKLLADPLNNALEAKEIINISRNPIIPGNNNAAFHPPLAFA
ncbi:Hypothetical protein MCYN_0236 [Mycoplasmopsis cynos C142]|uniref:Uncharacterized protein n=1 Tax=Mycoplasmopsis cynos (strain C142) TaxID=1246955 RepID=L0RUD6_MYCC1|nr:Hypothetical protein MCYN_0236 [Mycoplasmopsis cynos C142]